MSGRREISFRLGLLAVLVASTACAAVGLGDQLIPSVAAPVNAAGTTYRNDIPPRLQWNANFGYCGEVSFISAGLYYGQYASQYTARALASNDAPQYEYASQLLLGGNAGRAARAMHLRISVFPTRKQTTADEFLMWIERNVIAGYPVIAGAYTNEYRFYGKTNPRAGQASYDHIVPVLGITSAGATISAYDPHDTLTFSDNGLWDPGPVPPYLFTYAFGVVGKTRVQANARNGPIYSIPLLTPRVRNYGIAVTGIVDRDGDTLPVRVATNLNYERPAMKNHSNVRPSPMPLHLTITVSKLAQGTTYRLYEYDDFAKVPERGFNAHAADAIKRWTFRVTSGSRYVVSEEIESDRVAAYRAVPLTGP